MTLNCKEVNIVWVERGIVVILIYMIIKNYSSLKNKVIYISNKNLKVFFSYIFSELQFTDSDKNTKKIYYLNVRKNIRKSGINIDYLINYDSTIPTKKIWLVPYYDRNDPLILYEYDEKSKLDVKEYQNIINKFGKCERGNYKNNNVIWDIMFENSVLEKAKKFGKNNLFSLINKFLKSNYTNTIDKIYYPLLGYDELMFKKEKKTEPIKLNIINKEPDIKIEKVYEEKLINQKKEHNDRLSKLIKLMTEKMEKYTEKIKDVNK